MSIRTILSVVLGNIAGMPQSASHTRSDVQRNRRALLEAAQELLSTRGDVPMYEIARHAGVGQATLYRHFPDRRALLGAIAEEVLDGLEADAAAIPPGPDALATFLHRLVASMLRTHTLVQLAVAESADPREPGSLLHDLVQRLLGMVAVFVGQATAAGTLRPDVTADDVLIVLGMVKGVVDGVPVEEREAAAARALDFALHGILVAPPR